MDKRKADMRRQLQGGGGVRTGGRRSVKVSSRTKANTSSGFSRTAGASGSMPAIRGAGGGGISGRSSKSSTMGGRMQTGGSTRLPSVRGAASGSGVRGARAVRKAW